MAFTRNHKKVVPEGLDRKAEKEPLFELKPGDENKYRFPARDNQFYQLAITARYENDNTGKKITFGDSGKGRYITGDYIFSRERRIFDYQKMIQECIGFGYQYANTPSSVVIGVGDTDPSLFYGINWTLDKILHVFVLVKRNVRLKQNGEKRKVKPIVFIEKPSWKKAQLKKLAEKKSAQKAKITKITKKTTKVVRKEKVTLNKLKALHKKAKTSAEREKIRKAIWNKQHPRKR